MPKALLFEALPPTCACLFACGAVGDRLIYFLSYTRRERERGTKNNHQHGRFNALCFTTEKERDCSTYFVRFVSFHSGRLAGRLTPPSEKTVCRRFLIALGRLRNVRGPGPVD